MFRSSRPDFIETHPHEYRTRGQGPNCSGLPGRTSLRRGIPLSPRDGVRALFRSSRPDFIETICSVVAFGDVLRNCSGLPGRTSLRPAVSSSPNSASKLFRSSRPDFIETRLPKPVRERRRANCSGLPGRTSLRPPQVRHILALLPDCSGLPGRTSLRPPSRRPLRSSRCTLFRSSRPDFIETMAARTQRDQANRIVPVFQAGLH